MSPRHLQSLARRRARLTPRSRVLVICEGTVTEPSYFRELSRQERTRLIEVTVDDGGGTPKTLVERAAAKKKAAERLARREGDDFLKFDEVWCVFDIDVHPDIPDALQQAAANQIYLAISNPCFELWLLLHFRDQRAHLERHEAQNAFRHYVPNYQKLAPFDLLRSRHGEAVARAQALETWQVGQGRQRANPSTAVHHLTERLRTLGKDAFVRVVRG